MIGVSGKMLCDLDFWSFVLQLVDLVQSYGNRVFPKLDHSVNNARIVLEQNKFSKKATSSRD